jgi:hypothetical protein
MSFLMMWTPYYYWNAVFKWQKDIAEMMHYPQAKPQPPKAVPGDPDISSAAEPANPPVDLARSEEISAEANERQETPTDRHPAKPAKSAAAEPAKPSRSTKPSSPSKKPRPRQK